MFTGSIDRTLKPQSCRKTITLPSANPSPTSSELMEKTKNAFKSATIAEARGEVEKAAAILKTIAG